MRREQLEHIIRAACTVADDDTLVIVGSQAILGAYPDAPSELLVSNEADVYPEHHRDRADLVDGSIGEGSPFHDTFGYYAQGVGEETATLPAGWKERLVPICNERTLGQTGLCLEPHDLVVSKLIAGREKILRFARDAIRHGLVAREVLLERAATTELAEELRAVLIARIKAA